MKKIITCLLLVLLILPTALMPLRVDAAYMELADVFIKEFGSDNGTVLFEKACKELGVQYKFYSY